MSDRLDVALYVVVGTVHGFTAIALAPGGTDPAWLPWVLFATALVFYALAFSTYAKIRHREGQAKKESEAA